MRLDGSCQCGKVSFRVDSQTPVPFMYCYCSICRKTTGGAFGCNIMGRRDSLRVTGKKHLRCYHAVIRNPRKRAVRSEGERWFCGECGTHLYLLDDRWPGDGHADVEPGALIERRFDRRVYAEMTSARAFHGDLGRAG